MTDVEDFWSAVVVHPGIAEVVLGFLHNLQFTAHLQKLIVHGSSFLVFTMFLVFQDEVENQ